MSKFIIVTFPNEAKAFEGTRSLQALHDQGSLSLYEMEVVVRNSNGELIVKQSAQESAVGLTVGSLLGGLVGLMGGPLGGFVGLSGGALLGSISDLYNLGLSRDFLDNIAEDLKPGKVAIVAEVGEDWITPLNTAMEALGGKVLRRWRIDMEDEQSAREMAAMRAEHLALKKEWEQTKSDNKAALHEALEHLQQRMENTEAQVRARFGQLESSTEAKIKSLSEQATQLKDKTNEGIDRRIHELRKDLSRRSGQFKKAWSLTKDALKV